MKKELYWDMFRALLAIMSSRTRLTSVDAVGPASGGICISGDAEGCRMVMAVTIEEVEE